MAGPRRKNPSEPRTLNNIHKAKLAVSCPKCRHKAFVAVDQWPDGWPVALYGSIMECSKCGTMGATVRPVWKARRK
jgi:hypothetical protein